MIRYLILMISVFVFIIGFLVMLGWVGDVVFLKQIFPNAVSMKFLTACSFLFSAPMLYFMVPNSSASRDLSMVMVPITASLILFIMGTLLASALFDLRIGFEEIFIQDDPNAIYTVIPGLPSVGTMVAFVCIGIVGLISTAQFKYRKIVNCILGIVVMGIAAIALIGYALQIPSFFYLVEDFSTGMAIHTSILFLVLGCGVLLAQFYSPERNVSTKA